MKSRKMLFFWLILLAIIFALTALSSLLAPYEPNSMDMNNIYASPSGGHLLGTDQLGRDVLSRLLVGGQVTFLIAVVSVVISTIIGLIYGGISGYFGGMVDIVMMRMLEAFLTIPSLVIVLAFQAIMRGSVWSMAVIIGVTGWFVTARIVRSEFMRLKESEFVQMAVMFRTPTWKILFGHLLRNSFPAIFVVTLFNFAGAIFMEVSLSFLGIGVPPATPSWGTMLYSAQTDLLVGAWWIGLFPGLLIFFTILCLQFIGEALKKQGGERSHA
ncbi:ABC transporter permease [Lysinibacillus sphaericus]|uniref:Peptide/opine/nickel uptake ABC transporter permease n=1 Tax=Lysinibacillus sphaericus OT4b.31 TaxID=1285586 RepID=R7ZF25_LYSSH|nr:ABC transporter permease [Lysinibacillus sphaericus]EON72737.1 peptide/opine/nickel uptake ABC transporter permease [Lysinibacillus sphaericus OT4b.31]